jgi:hypothetical protein
MIQFMFAIFIRIVITVACIFTILTCAAREGYSIPFNTLIISCLLLILMIKTWK